MMTEYKRFVAQYIILAIYNQYKTLEEASFDIKTNFILLYINNTLAELMKY